MFLIILNLEGLDMYYKRILDLREERFWTQQYVAKQLNISQRSYSHYENGTRNIPIDIVCKLADLYKVSTDYILERTNNI